MENLFTARFLSQGGLYWYFILNTNKSYSYCCHVDPWKETLNSYWIFYLQVENILRTPINKFTQQEMIKTLKKITLMHKYRFSSLWIHFSFTFLVRHFCFYPAGTKHLSPPGFCPPPCSPLSTFHPMRIHWPYLSSKIQPLSHSHLLHRLLLELDHKFGYQNLLQASL